MKTISIHSASDSLSDSVARDNVRLRCGDCVHYAGSPNRAIGDVPCSEMGVLRTKQAPGCYSPDLTALRPMGAQSLRAMYGLLMGMTPKQSRVFMGLMRSASSVERLGFTFMQRVYFGIGQPGSLEALYYGYVLGKGAEGTVAIAGENLVRGKSALCIAYLDPKSVMTRKKFEALRDKLSAEGHVFEPPARQPVPASLLYEPPSFDTPPEQLEARAKRPLSKKKRDVETALESSAPAKTRGSKKLFSHGGL